MSENEGNNMGPRFYRSQRHDPHFGYDSIIWFAYKIIENSDIYTLLRFLSKYHYEIDDLRPILVFKAAYKNKDNNILKLLVENGFTTDNSDLVYQLEKNLEEHDLLNIFTSEGESKFNDAKVKELVGTFLYSLQFGELPEHNEFSKIPEFLKDKEFDIISVLREVNKRVNLLSEDAKNIIKYLKSLFGEEIIPIIHSTIQSAAWNRRKHLLKSRKNAFNSYYKNSKGGRRKITLKKRRKGLHK
jgi:hypothetical protein